MSVVRKLLSKSSGHPKVDEFIHSANEIILDKERQIDLAFCCVIARGHLLIEDVPGVGKTTLVKTFSKLLGLQTSRVQFTNDLLPSDILGVSIFDKNKSTFNFQKGPIFAQMVFADELNRATPKTQSAFLQAMEENHVTVDGQSYELQKPFIVVATQNPRQNIGTFDLPESQLDRFLMKIKIGFPSRAAEKSLLLGEKRAEMLERLQPVMTPEDLIEIQNHVDQIKLSSAIVEYIQDITEQSRQADFKGLSPRGALYLVAASRAWAFLQGRKFVIPEDVQNVAVSVIQHRINPENQDQAQNTERLAQQIIDSVPVKE